MSIFSVFKRGRRREKEKSEKSAEGKQRQDTKSAYKDVPNRGAIDEFLNTPPTSRTKDRPRIAEGHRRGSSVPNVAINGTHSSGTPRVPSGLSNVMYPAAHADPTVTTQRTYSFQGPLQLHHENNKMNANIVHPVPEPLYVPEVLKLPSGKGKELERGFTPGSSRTPSLIADKGKLLLLLLLPCTTQTTCPFHTFSLPLCLIMLCRKRFCCQLEQLYHFPR